MFVSHVLYVFSVLTVDRNVHIDIVLCTLTIVPSLLLFFSFFSLSTDRHGSEYTVDSPCTHIWIETGLESIVFSETTAVILSSCLHTCFPFFLSFSPTRPLAVSISVSPSLCLFLSLSPSSCVPCPSSCLVFLFFLSFTITFVCTCTSSTTCSTLFFGSLAPHLS